METQDIIQMITSLIDSLGTVGILIWAWYQERKRADMLENEILSDWRRQSDREMTEPLPYRQDIQ